MWRRSPRVVAGLRHQPGAPFSILIVSVLVIAYSGVVRNAAADTDSAAPCSGAELALKSVAAASLIDQAEALHTAIASNDYAQFVGSNESATGIEYSGVFETSNMSLATCTVEPESVNVVFTVPESGSSFTLVLAENPTLSKVVNASVQVPSPRYVLTGWNGWDFETVGRTAFAAFTLPTASVPSNSSHCGGAECIVAIWGGLTNQAGGGTPPTGYIAQGGASLWMTCSKNLFNQWHCPVYYSGWYEWFPSGPVTCTSFTPVPGDLLGDLVTYNQSTNGYSISIDDVTKGKSCTALSPSNFSMGSPQFGNFIAEDPGPAPHPILAQFSDFAFQMADPLGYHYTGGINDMLGLSRDPWTGQSNTIRDGTPFYGHSYPPANCVSYTCYNVTYI